VDNVLYKYSEELSMERLEGQRKGKSREISAGDQLLEAALSTEFGGSPLSRSRKKEPRTANP